MKKLTFEQKQNAKGGSFYAIALGIGILASTISSLVCNIVTASKAGSLSATELNASLKRSAMVRLSPVPSRSSVMVY